MSRRAEAGVPEVGALPRRGDRRVEPGGIEPAARDTLERRDQPLELGRDGVHVVVRYPLQGPERANPDHRHVPATAVPFEPVAHVPALVGVEHEHVGPGSGGESVGGEGRLAR